MSFLTPALLGGLALVALPIVLHLVMRREPQRVEFPALRFVRTRQSTNQHRLRLRHWLLLALRCAFVLLLVLALARPVLRGSGLLGSGEAGLAAALVFDTSPRMLYQQKNKTRLESAKEMASWLLEQLPAESEVAVVDPARARRAKLADRDGALLRTERIRVSPAAAPLADAVVEAVNLVNERADHRREVYVFTDLANVVWNDAALARIGEALDSAEKVKLYLVDVGTEEHANVGLGEVELSAEYLATGESLTLRTGVYRMGGGPDQGSVEMWLAGPDRKSTKRGEQTVEFNGPSSTVEFPVAGLESGVHQGYLRLTGDDSLPIDNTRFFTVGLESPPRLLLAGGRAEDTLLLREALAPSSLAQTAAPRFVCESIAIDRMASTPLATYDAVALVDPPPFDIEAWRKLSEFVQSGGGVAIFLGRRAVGHLEAFNTPAPRLVLPGELKWVSTKRTYLQPMSYEHPVLKGLADIGEATPWPAFPVFKYWQLGALDPAATVIARFADGSPAIVEGVFGSGRVLVMATSVSDLASGSGTGDPWNLLPTNPDPWPFLALVEGMADYLVGADTRPLNYEAGNVVALPLPRRSDLATYVLEPPTGDPLPQSLTPGQQEIVVTNTDEVGNYRVVSGGQTARLDRGFTVNAASDVGRLERASPSTVTASLGANRVELARDRRALSSTIDLGRVGRELYPWVIVLVALAFGCEQWLADRFYERRIRDSGVGNQG
ncbi:MAG: BatA domain-containing protein [Aeoliella sp.]